MTIFGPMLDGAAVEAALLDHLKLWLPTYLAEVVRQRDPEGELWPNGLAPVRNYTVVHNVEEKWPEDQLPMLLAYCPGISGEPQYRGDGEVSAIFACGLSAIASAATLTDTKQITRAYATAAKAAIIQHEDLGGFALGTRWKDERNYPVVQGVEAERNLMAVSMIYEIEVEEILNRHEGPQAPTVEPPDEWPTVKETEVEITMER
jgi:hypothetical protein